MGCGSVIGAVASVGLAVATGGSSLAIAGAVLGAAGAITGNKFLSFAGMGLGLASAASGLSSSFSAVGNAAPSAATNVNDVIAANNGLGSAADNIGTALRENAPITNVAQETAQSGSSFTPTDTSIGGSNLTGTGSVSASAPSITDVNTSPNGMIGGSNLTGTGAPDAAGGYTPTASDMTPNPVTSAPMTSAPAAPTAPASSSVLGGIANKLGVDPSKISKFFNDYKIPIDVLGKALSGLSTADQANKLYQLKKQYQDWEMKNYNTQIANLNAPGIYSARIDLTGANPSAGQSMTLRPTGMLSAPTTA